MEITIANLILFLAASLALITTPGPDMLYVITRSISQGKRAGYISSVGVSVGILAHTILAALGLSLILKTSATAFLIVKFAGAAYLIYLGIKTVVNKGSFVTQGEEGGNISTRELFTQGLLSNLLNPKVALFFMSFLPQFVGNNPASYTLNMLLLGGLFFILGLLVLFAISFGSDRIGSVLKKNSRVANSLGTISGLVLILLGLKLAWPSNR